MLWIQNQKTESQLNQGPLDALRQESGDPHVCQLNSKKSASQKLMQGFAGPCVQQKRSAGA